MTSSFCPRGCGKLIEQLTQKHSSFKLSSVTVRCYDGINYLSVSKDSHTDSVEDIGNISTLQSGGSDRPVISCLVEGEIVAVQCMKYIGCSKCNVKVESVKAWGRGHQVLNAQDLPPTEQYNNKQYGLQ